MPRPDPQVREMRNRARRGASKIRAHGQHEIGGPRRMRESISWDALAACREAANQSLYTYRSLQEHITEERGGQDLM